MLQWLISSLRRRRMRRQLLRLGSSLVDRYSHRSWYTIGQVRAVASAEGLASNARVLAYAMFLNQKDYDCATDEEGLDTARTFARNAAVEVIYGVDELPSFRSYERHIPDGQAIAEVVRNWFSDRPMVPGADNVCYDGGYRAACDPTVGGPGGFGGAGSAS